MINPEKKKKIEFHNYKVLEKHLTKNVKIKSDSTFRCNSSAQRLFQHDLTKIILRIFYSGKTPSCQKN